MHWIEEQAYLRSDPASVLLVLREHRRTLNRPSDLSEISAATGIADPTTALHALAAAKHALPINGRWASR